MDKEKSSTSKGNSDNNIETPEVECENCKKSFQKDIILKHIGQRKACKSHYGSRFKDLKRYQDTERITKYRENMSLKKREEIKKSKREKSKIEYEKRKEREKERKQRNLSLAAKGLNCDGLKGSN